MQCTEYKVEPIIKNPKDPNDTKNSIRRDFWKK